MWSGGTCDLDLLSQLQFAHGLPPHGKVLHATWHHSGLDLQLRLPCSGAHARQFDVSPFCSRSQSSRIGVRRPWSFQDFVLESVSLLGHDCDTIKMLHVRLRASESWSRELWFVGHALTKFNSRVALTLFVIAGHAVNCRGSCSHKI